ncbi:branched-chain amino acid ABC transporter permease [Merismopedia glauca]|uniref:Branched-chain amino acid ABC transporter permease n=1 Tax=Merismopedia glauca CCAP 1448/3 TaxID=1296344 RepID=A0A2T1BXT7_9CYAN|nr:branched-chain amino acid ABC transporter permease [Merismopedia glauca]PSB00811.1 branched-chain amino acid ABC transporter permease [Merismopedia glauca CCAP 1448/3]
MSNQLKQFFKSTITLGAIASLTILIFGGWSGAVIGWLLGTAIGLTSGEGKRVANPLQGAKLAVLPGFGVGIWLLIASLVQGLWLLPASGQRGLSVSSAMLFGLYSLAITVAAAVIMGAIQGLPSYRRQIATLFNIGAIAIIFPFIDQIAQTRWIATVIEIQIFVMLALGLNIVVGFAGLLDLGYAAFFAIGAYTTGLLSSSQLGIQWNFWLVLPIAAVIAGITGVILGAPTLRLRGDYIAIVTLGFGEIVPVVFRNLTSVRLEEPISKIIGTFMGHPEWAICLLGCDRPINLTGGEAGINPIGRPILPIIGTFTSSNYFPWYYLILLLVIFSYFLIGRLKDSRLGRSWTAIREDELAASAMGINLVQTKLLAFAMGATFSGFAGSFYASYITAIFPSVFDFSVSVIILCMVILGGLGNAIGVMLGGVIIMSADRLYLPQLAKVLKGVLNNSVLPNIANPQWQDFLATSIDPTQMRLFLFGLTLVIMMLVRPEGLLPDRIHQEELHGNETEKPV